MANARSQNDLSIIEGTLSYKVSIIPTAFSTPTAPLTTQHLWVHQKCSWRLIFNSPEGEFYCFIQRGVNFIHAYVISGFPRFPYASIDNVGIVYTVKQSDLRFFTGCPNSVDLETNTGKSKMNTSQPTCVQKHGVNGPKAYEPLDLDNKYTEII